MNQMKKYPKAEKFLRETGMTLDQALEFFEKEEEEGVNFGKCNSRDSISL